jgi:hypothetical protein
MSKLGLHDPFGYLKHKLCLKEGLGVKLAIWLPTTKSQESPWFFYFQVACHIPLESSWWGLEICFRLHFKSLHTKLWASKVARVPILGISRLQLGLGTKWHLGAGPMANHKEYYKGEGGGFPQVQTMLNLVSLCLPVVRPCTKSVLTTH